MGMTKESSFRYAGTTAVILTILMLCASITVVILALVASDSSGKSVGMGFTQMYEVGHHWMLYERGGYRLLIHDPNCELADAELMKRDGHVTLPSGY